MNGNLSTPNEEALWLAVQNRDPSYNGRMFYGVRSTGVYCRPTCPSRRPRRDRVAFFATCEDAEAAGFRACRRCNPRGMEPAAELVAQACRLLEASEEPLRLAALAERLHVSPYHLHRTFKAATGLTPRQYAAGLRVEALKSELRSGSTVTGATYEAGFNSGSRMYESARRILGMKPSTYQKGGKDMEIQYTFADTPLGRMLVAATNRGVCAVTFGDDDTKLARALRDEYPAAAVTYCPTPADEMTAYVAVLQSHLLGQQPNLDLPLDVQATAFRLRVWEALRQVPYGETRTYTQLAEAVGQPSAVRAVASACAANPTALITPCHRIVRSDGSLGGYRWGLQRKKALLQKEISG